jgi:acyl-CoA thioester hydrolase
MRHVYRCPMRWADLDLLGHVNNVVYVDYLQEARVDLLRAQVTGARSAGLAEGVVVVRHEVTYRAPLSFDYGTVDIEVWVTDIRAASFTMAYEVFHERDGERLVYLRATTVLTPYVFATERPRRITPEERAGLERYLEPVAAERRPTPPPVARTELGHYPVHVRFSDVDAYGHVNNVKYLEYFQEGRLLLISRLAEGLSVDVSVGGMVAAQMDVDYRTPLTFRDGTYDLWSQVTHVGRTSMRVEAEIRDGDVLCARAVVVLVFWDPATGRPQEPRPEVRARALAAMAEGGLTPAG